MSPSVTLVIPCRDGAETLGPCFEAILPALRSGALQRLVVVDDGSRDATAAVARRYGAEVLTGRGEGAGAARNLGWRHVDSDLIWFVDADCVAEPDSLPVLLDHLRTAESTGGAPIAGVGGSYGNMRPEALLSRLIHEEIVARHAKMPEEVGFLATFNVLYRRSALMAVGGFDPRFLKGQDAELAYRLRALGWRLRFERRSLVRHYHIDRLAPYLRVQRKQGYWRAFLAAQHRQGAGGDGYASRLEALPPALALAMIGALPACATPVGVLVEAGLLTALLACHAPMAAELVRRTDDPTLWAYVPMASARAFVRGVGLAHGGLDLIRERAASWRNSAKRGADFDAGPAR